jgi:2-dehydro-3-deoxy-D-arabinonate dehydratase
VLLTGTGIVPPDEFACEEGDVIEIGADEIGVLRNPALRVS